MQFFEFFKHVSVSKMFAFAVFGASATLLVGPNFFPLYIPEMQPLWRPFAAAIMVFSGVYLVGWVLLLFWQVGVKAAREFGFWWCSKPLTFQDKLILELMASQNYAMLNIANVSEVPGKVTRLELIQYAKGLQRMGLVKFSDYDEYIVTLTERGKQRAVQLLKESRIALANSNISVNEG